LGGSRYLNPPALPEVIESMQRAMAKVKQLTPRGTSLNIEHTIVKINKWYKGWATYHKMGQYPNQLAIVEAHIRRRLRSRLVSEQKKRRHLFNTLVKRGVSRGLTAKAVFSNHKRWALSHTKAVERANPNRWFIHTLGQAIASTEQHPHWFAPKISIKLT